VTASRKKSWRIISILDDRGIVRDLVSPPANSEWRAMPWWRRSKHIATLGPEWKAEYDHMQKASGTYGGICGLTVTGTASLANWLLAPLLSGMPSWIVSATPSLFAGVLMWPLFPVVAWNFRRSAAPGLRAAYLAAHRCPSCGFDLTGLATAPDGNTLCPECGAAWRLPGPRTTVQMDRATLSAKPSPN
jgi:hypothetical protein